MINPDKRKARRGDKPRPFSKLIEMLNILDNFMIQYLF